MPRTNPTTEDVQSAAFALLSATMSAHHFLLMAYRYGDRSSLDTAMKYLDSGLNKALDKVEITPREVA